MPTNSTSLRFPWFPWCPCSTWFPWLTWLAWFPCCTWVYLNCFWFYLFCWIHLIYVIYLTYLIYMISMLPMIPAGFPLFVMICRMLCFLPCPWPHYFHDCIALTASAWHCMQPHCIESQGSSMHGNAWCALYRIAVQWAAVVLHCIEAYCHGWQGTAF